MRLDSVHPAIAGLFASLSLVVMAFVATPAFADRDPDDVVEILYDAYEDEDTPGILENGRLVQMHFTARLADLMGRHRGRLQFDPVIDGQDRDISDVEIDVKGQRGEVVVVEVRFENAGEQKRVGYALVEEDGAWRIDDIASDGAHGRWVLSKLLSGEHLTGGYR